MLQSIRNKLTTLNAKLHTGLTLSAGTVTFWIFAAVDGYYQVKVTGKWEPRDWEILVLTSTLGIASFNIGRKPPDRKE